MTERDVKAEADKSAERKDAAHTDAAKHHTAAHNKPKASAEALGKQLESAREDSTKANQKVAKLTDQHDHAVAHEQLQAMETEHKKADKVTQKALEPQIQQQRGRVDILKAKVDAHKDAD